MVSKLGRRARVAAVGMLAAAALGLVSCTPDSPTRGPGDVDTIDGAVSEQIDAAVEGALQASGSTEAIVGVWTSGGDYVRAYGGEGLTANSLIRGAQATQPVVCALMLAEAEDGLDLDREITEDLSRQIGIEGITYRQLCEGTSGLADFKSAYADIFANNPSRPWASRELFSQGLVASPLPWPGKNVYRSDTNALLAARALPVYAGEPLHSMLKERVFDRLGMSATFYPENLAAQPLSGPTLTPLTYPLSGGQPVCAAGVQELESVSPSMLGGAGATVTTVTDLKTFTEAYVGGEFGDVTTDARPLANPERDSDGNPTSEPDESGPQWGFGIERVGPLWGMSGLVTGTVTAAYHAPDADFSVVVALNNSAGGSGKAQALAFQLASIAGVDTPWTADEQAAALAKYAICPGAGEEGEGE